MLDYHDYYTWNEVFEYYQDLQRSMLYNFHSWECDLWDYDYHEESCIEFWIRKLNEISEATEFDLSVLNNLIFVENERFLLIRYNQYEVYNGFQWDNFYSECRSLVIDKKKDKMALVPFRKFCNYNENEAYSAKAIAKRINNSDEKTIEVSNKLDGSMISCRYYDDELLASTSKMLDRNESVLLDNAYKYIETHENYMKMLQDLNDITFIFEYISLDDPHIVAYNEEDCGLHLIGARSVKTGYEVPYITLEALSELYGVKVTEVYNMTFEEVLDSIANDEKKANEAEGFVVNINGFKVKVKYNDFVQIHHAVDELSTPKVVLNAIIDGTYDDMYAKIPAAYQPRIRHVHDVIWKFRKYKKELALYYLSKAPSIKEDRKAFMQWVDDNVPVRYAGLVRCLALGKNYDYFKGFRYYRAVEFVNMCEANLDWECQ